MEKADDMLFFSVGGFFHFVGWVRLYLRTKELSGELGLHFIFFFLHSLYFYVLQ